MKRLTILLQTVMLLAVISFLAIIPACNAKDEPTSESTTANGTVAVTAFSLSANPGVMRNLDSVFFSIDLEHGVIFNADSLPKGTNVTALIPKITYPSTVTSAVIEMTGGEHRTGTVDYRNNPNDTIDFTGKVTLTLKANDGNLSKVYNLKVNVHLQDPDTLYWEQMASSPLPARKSNPKAQKAVKTENGIVCFIEEGDGTYTLASTPDIFTGNWTKTELAFGFTPAIETACYAGSSFYILDDNGNLYSAPDSKAWKPTGDKWSNIIGEYNGSLLGLRNDAGTPVSTLLSESGISDITIPARFPVNGFSAPIVFNSEWYTSPLLIITGGETAEGALSGATWAFDGEAWANISNTPLPEIYAPSVCRYYSYLKSSAGKLKEFEVLLAFGGQLANGKNNKTVYLSYNQGITWQTAPHYAQLPDFMPALFGADIITEGLTLDSNLSDRWKSKRKLNYEIDGDILSWECPYLFLFGGYGEGGNLSEDVYSGVLRRLTFAPLF